MKPPIHPGAIDSMPFNNGAGGFGAITPGSGVAAFLRTPIAGIPSTWLQSGAAVASLGYTPPPNTRTISTSGLLTGGGDLSANRTISIAAQAACTIVSNATGGSAVPTAVTLGTGLACSAGQIVNTGSGSGDVAGPASAVSGNIATYNGTTGKIIQDGGLAVGSLVPTTRTVTAGTGLTGGGDLSANRTLSVNTSQNIATLSNLTSNGLVKTSGGVGTLGIAAAGTDYAAATTGGANTPLFNNGSGGHTNGTRSGNTTTVVTKDASSPATNDCAKWDASGNLTTAGAACGAGGGSPGGSSGQIEWNNAGSFDGLGVGNGLSIDTTNKKLNLTGALSSKTGADYTVLAADAGTTFLVGGHTYTLAQAGTAGFGNGFGVCFQNTSASDATISTTTSTFKGAGGATTLTLQPNTWACPTSDGTNYDTPYAPSTFGIATNARLFANGGGGIAGGTTSGNTTQVVTTTGAQTSGKCVTIDASGNHVADANACGGAGASPGGSSGDIQYNNAGAFGGARLPAMAPASSPRPGRRLPASVSRSTPTGTTSPTPVPAVAAAPATATSCSPPAATR